MNRFDLIGELASRLGWIFKDNGVYTTFQKFSTAGHDFSIDLSVKDIYDIKSQLSDRYYNFDVSEEAYLWLDEFGHGKNGAPYDMLDVYNDSKECKEMLEELVNMINDFVENIQEE